MAKKKTAPKRTAPKSKSKTKATKQLPLLLTDDIIPGMEREKRSVGVRACAGLLAKRLGARIDLVHVEDLSLYPVGAPAYKPLINRYFAQQKERLSGVARSIEVPTKAMFVNGEPVRKILSLAPGHELVALGTHGRKGLGRLILGSVAEEVIRNSMVPVLTVGPHAQESGSALLAEPELTILAATGLTPNSDRAVDYAVSLASRLGAKLVLFHSLHESMHPVLQTAFSAPGASQELEGLLTRLRDNAARRLEQQARKLSRKGIDVSFALDHATVSAADAVLEQARKSKAALIVMGTHGRSMVAGAFFGRTARNVMLEATAPVVTVRSRRS